MSDEELIARLRDEHVSASRFEAADRIEALIAENKRDGEQAVHLMIKHFGRAEAAEAALREIEAISVHSGGETHGVTADHWKMAFEQAQSIASAALK